jgi:hypothetical protein
MNQHDKKPDEAAAIALLKRLMPAFPRGRLIASESPDYILIVSRKESIGIEITRIDPSTECAPDQEMKPGAKQWLNLNTILSTIDRKEEKRSIYQRKKLSQLWLVIITGYDVISPAKRIPPNLERLKISSTTFQRIILVDFSAKNHHILFDGSGIR